MLGRKTAYHHRSFQKIHQDINTFGKKNEHYNKHHNVSHVGHQNKHESNEPTKSQYEK
jgi:hypothetical protein